MHTPRINSIQNSTLEKNNSVSIIIVNWNAGKLLSECIEHLSRQTIKPKTIYVVDNASTDNSLDNIRNQYSIELIELTENTGFAKANNIALQKIDTTYVALLNPDAFPAPDWLKNLLEAAERHPEAASFGSLQLMDTVEPKIDGIGDCYHISGLAWRELHNHKYPIEPLLEKEIFSPCAAAALYRMDALRNVGEFEESFFCYMEDIDLGFRLRLAGYNSWFVPSAVVTHVGSATSGGKHSDFAVYHGHRNLVWVFIRNMPTPLLLLFLPVHIMLNIVTLLVFYTRRQYIIGKSKRDAFFGIHIAFAQRRKIQKNRIASSWKILSLLRFLK
ncbi:glycosyltransferase [Deefgea chitinilytica]|uniref:Glycosyltransferase n=2 Tax=Chitinibacteraceae TaxID=2897177 RepID=A0ABS2C798_9NEIS|nr:glycosyltransferase [Deefgea chitinilytica]MBM9887255.1 glycosyltransferase family 2 protein [Deefgea sp. CFH1-16]